MSGRISTEQLAMRAKNGDQEAIRCLVVRFGPPLERFVACHLGEALQGQLEPEDIVQEAFAKAFQVIRNLKWQGEKAFFNWLRSIAKNLILSASKKNNRVPLRLTCDIPADATSPSKRLRREERFERFQKALNALSEDHRRVILLVRIEGLGIEEIASRMGRSPNAVKKLLARALRELKKAFGETESFELPGRRLDVEEAENE